MSSEFQEMAVLRVSSVVLAEFLMLPKGADIVDATMEFPEPGVVLLKVLGMGEFVRQGDRIPRMVGHFSRHDDGSLSAEWKRESVGGLA